MIVTPQGHLIQKEYKLHTVVVAGAGLERSNLDLALRRLKTISTEFVQKLFDHGRVWAAGSSAPEPDMVTSDG